MVQKYKPPEKVKQILQFVIGNKSCLLMRFEFSGQNANVCGSRIKFCESF